MYPTHYLGQLPFPGLPSQYSRFSSTKEVGKILIYFWDMRKLSDDGFIFLSWESQKMGDTKKMGERIGQTTKGRQK